MACTIVIPAAGRGSRMAQFEVPKPLIEVNGKTILQRTIESWKDSDFDIRFVFITRKYDNELYNYKLESIMEHSCKDYVNIPIDYTTEGAACSIVLAEPYLNMEDMLITADSDICFEGNTNKWMQHFKETNAYSMLITMKSDLPHYSYAAIDYRNNVMRTAEKMVISDYASVGIHFWKNFLLFKRALENAQIKNIRTNNEFYVCPLHNFVIDHFDNTQYYHDPNEKFYHLGTPKELTAFQTQ